MDQLSLYDLQQQILGYLNGQYVGGTISGQAPVLSRPLNQSNGIVLTGSFQTNDGTTEGRPMYCTVLRQHSVPSVHDGFGFAVIKGDGLTSYNVYIVDNNILTDSVVLGETFIPGPHINKYISAAMTEILINTLYNYEFRINNDWSTSLTIWQSGYAKPGTATLTSGALAYGPLGYASSQLQNPITGSFFGYTSGTEVGFGVENPSGYIWQISEFSVSSISGGIPIQVFEFVNSTTQSQGITGNVQLTYFGSGQSTTSNFALDSSGNITSGSVCVSGLDFYIAMNADPTNLSNLNQNSVTPWELLGSSVADHQTATDTFRRFVGVSQHPANYYEFAGRVFIAVTKNFLQNGADPNTPSIRTNYIELSAQSISPIKDRKTVDVWIDPINYIEFDSISTVLGSDSTQLFNVPNIKTPVLFTQSIIDNTSQTNLLSYTGSTGSQVTPVNHQDGLLFSDRESYDLEFSNSLTNEAITINYFHCKTKVSQIESLLNSTNYRSPASDVLVRVLPPLVVSISPLYPLQYKGSASPVTVQNVIINYINGLGYSDTLYKSDILSTLYSNGISYINLTNFHVFVDVYDYQWLFVETLEITDSFTPSSSLNRYLTFASLLNVTQLT